MPWGAGTLLEESRLDVADDEGEIGRGSRRAVSVISLSAFAGRGVGRLGERALERLK